MTKIAYSLTLLSAMLACASYAAPAHARARVFVASYGSDSNPCTFGSPCRTFQQAHDVVDAGGEVTAIDSAGFGPISINKAVTITSPAGVEAGIVPVSGGTAITIIGHAADLVMLNGLTIDGASGGVTGIVMELAGTLVITHCIVRNFTSSGIALAPYTSSNITVSDTIVANNGGHGIYVQPPEPFSNSTGVHYVVFNRVQALGNAQKGFGIFANLSSKVFISAIAIDSVAASDANNTTGFYALGGSFEADARLQVFRSIATGNNYGVRAEGGGQITVSESHIEGNQISWSVDSANSKVISYGNNRTGDTRLPSVTINKN